MHDLLKRWARLKVRFLPLYLVGLKQEIIAEFVLEIGLKHENECLDSLGFQLQDHFKTQTHFCYLEIIG